ncbi:hypothetical protein [Streptomyces sp. AC1-42T]|uniref:hypothetical protein n=1 Tax=Streptomyces sp. AC1-42T TaxID=2218665 RepID=UPI000DAD6CBE|nr:hypothetical protein [Streptomyces sp. AC1-42T]PZT71582.1 hypothetical protein DNK55_33295 [Streptomyces sp. AC1-42T]
MWWFTPDPADATGQLLAPLRDEGWVILTDRTLPKSHIVLPQVLVPPCGRGLVVPVSHRWPKRNLTVVVGGRLKCGRRSKQAAVRRLADLARRTQRAVSRPKPKWKDLGMVPALVVHGSPIFRHRDLVECRQWPSPITVLGPDGLLPALQEIPGEPDPTRAGALAERTAFLLPEA